MSMYSVEGGTDEFLTPDILATEHPIVHITYSVATKHNVHVVRA